MKRKQPTGYGLQLAVVIILTVILGACGSSDSDMDNEPDPEASGEAIWSHLQDENYSTSWPLWPGTEEQQEGNEPHGMLQTIYLNNTAFQAVTNGEIPLPGGSIVVKENYMPDGTFAAATTMYKVDGFNPEANDWFWLQNEPDGTILAEGIVDGCQDCHSQAAGDDYLFLYSKFPPEGISKLLMHAPEDKGTLLADITEEDPDFSSSSFSGTPLSDYESERIGRWISTVHVGE